MCICVCERQSRVIKVLHRTSECRGSSISSTMELVTELANNYFAFVVPIAFVVIVAGLVFIFGFKQSVEPKFDKLLLADDRKPAGKKRKTKEKKTSANGHATNVTENKHEKSPAKEPKRSPSKDAPIEIGKQQKEKKQEINVNKQAEKKQEINVNKQAEKKQEINVNKQAEKKQVRARETIEETKNKKNVKKTHEKPADFDEGDWETVISKSDKKNRKNQEFTPPPKKEKSNRKEKKDDLIISPIEINKSVKDEVNKDLKEKDKINKEKTDNKKENEKIIEVVLIPAAELDKNNEASKDTKSKKKMKKPKSELAEEIPKEKPAKKEPVQKKDESKREPQKKEKKLESVPKKEKEESLKENVVLLKEPTKKEAKKKSDSARAAENLLNAEKVSATATANVAFDELGDTWTEAKAAKKSKKKARKDN